MMSDDEDYAIFGSPLEPIDEGNFHERKAPRKEDQFVTDKQGRRRFHGAFTGGFSAGYFNTVDTKEGWAPTTFVSSRSQRAEAEVAIRKPMDFMDEDDLGEHGIAPQRIQTTANFSSVESLKRKREPEQTGPIPGIPVLKDILKPIRETVGIHVLKKFGWRSGQGIGPRISRKEKKRAGKESQKMYGCQPLPENSGKESSSEESDTECGHKFAPEDQDIYLPQLQKTNLFGLGYVPLSRTNVLGGHINLFGPSSLQMTEKNKKVSIRGQAFGVGAFEEEDDDIYGKEDMSHYDFALGPPTEPASQGPSQRSLHNLTDQLEGFVISCKPWKSFKSTPLPQLPPKFDPRHVPRKRRFELKDSERQGLGRHELSVEDRQRILSSGSEVRFGMATTSGTSLTGNLPQASPNVTGSEKAEGENLDASTLQSNNSEKELQEFISETNFGPAPNFKPFQKDSEKQRRYDIFFKMKEKGIQDRYYLLQPKKMTEWEKERERKEFNVAASLYKPLDVSIAARFISGSHLEEPTLKDGLSVLSKETATPSGEAHSETRTGGDDSNKAAKSKMFGLLTQQQVEWRPDPLLCKRFFVTNPFANSSLTGVSKSTNRKVSIFNFMQAPVEETAGLQNIPNPVRSANDGMSAVRSASDRMSASSDSVDINDSIEDNDTPETYGLKVPVDGPPTIDLFKAIFDDSDSENEISNMKEPDASKTTDNNGMNVKAEVKQNEDTFARSKKFSENSSEDIKPYYKSDSTEATSRFQSPLTLSRTSNASVGSDAIRTSPRSTEPHSKMSSESPSTKATGIFSNIDFEALNQYRYNRTASFNDMNDTTLSESPSKHHTTGVKSEELSTSLDLDSDMEQFGPKPPSPAEKTSERINYVPFVESQGTWVEKKCRKHSGKHKSKHKKKKKKKDRKHKRSE